MRYLARCFWVLLKVGVATMLQYRGEIILWSIWGLVNPAVLYAIFSAAAQSNPDQTMAGMGRDDLAAYYLLMMVLGHLTAAWDTHELGWMIRTGRLSSLLLRPILPMWNSLATNISYKICTTAFVLPMWLLFAWLVKPSFGANAWQVALGLVATLLAIALNYFLGYVVALIGFWATKLDAVGEIYFGLSMFLSGRFAPLQAMPPVIGALAEVLPFKYMAAFPADLLMGRIASLPAALAGLAIQSAWLIVTLVLFRVGWSAAVRRYTAVSG